MIFFSPDIVEEPSMARNPVTGELMSFLGPKGLEKIRETQEVRYFPINEYYMRVVDKDDTEYLIKTDTILGSL